MGLVACLVNRQNNKQKEKREMKTTTECRYCYRPIIETSEGWADPQATGDDRLWRFTCDSHDTFTAEHQPTAETERPNQVYLDPTNPQFPFGKKEETTMNYQQLQDYSLQVAIEEHLCNVDDLITDGKTMPEILEMVENNDNEIVIYEPYEYYEPSSLVESIENKRGVYLYQFLSVLTSVNGTEWVTNYKKGQI